MTAVYNCHCGGNFQSFPSSLSPSTQREMTGTHFSCSAALQQLCAAALGMQCGICSQHPTSHSRVWTESFLRSHESFACHSASHIGRNFTDNLRGENDLIMREMGLGLTWSYAPVTAVMAPLIQFQADFPQVSLVIFQF